MGISPAKRFRVLTRDRFRCRYCGQRAPRVELEIDHIHPRALGGTDDERNLITACRTCNIGKSSDLLHPCALAEIDGEIVSLVHQLALYAVHYEDVAERLVQISGDGTHMEDWLGALWELLGELDCDVVHGDREDVRRRT